MPKQPEDQSPLPEENVPEQGEMPDTGDGLDEPNAEPDDSVIDTVPIQDVDLESLQNQLWEAEQRTLRINAELENYRKRSQRILEEERRYAGLPLMRDLLTVMDNLQRAIEAARQHEDAAGLLEGVEMVADQLGNILKQHHCEEIPAEGAAFDPHRHEAIAQFPSDEVEPGAITQVTQVGYELHGRVVRPAQVIVSAGKPESA